MMLQLKPFPAAAGLLLASLTAMPLASASVVTVTDTGIITADSNNGALVGDTYTETFSFDPAAAPNQFSFSSDNFGFGPGYVSATVNVGNGAYTFSTDGANYGQNYMSTTANGGNLDELYNLSVGANGYTNAYTFGSGADPLLAQLNWYAQGQVSDYQVNSMSVNDAVNGENLTGTVTAQTLNGGVPVPEPATIALLGLGLLGFGVKRKKAA